MKIRFVLIALTGLLAVAACNTTAKKDAAKTEAAKPKGKYYCTMNPKSPLINPAPAANAAWSW